MRLGAEPKGSNKFIGLISVLDYLKTYSLDEYIFLFSYCNMKWLLRWVKQKVQPNNSKKQHMTSIQLTSHNVSVKAAYTFICDSYDVHAYVGKSPMSAIFMRKDDLCSIVLKGHCSINGLQDSSKKCFLLCSSSFALFMYFQKKFLKRRWWGVRN